MRRKTTKCGALFDYAEPEFDIAPLEISYPPPAVQEQVFPRREAIRDLYYYQKAEPSVKEGGQGQGQYIPYSRLTNAEKTRIEHGRDAIDQAANDGRSWRELGHVGRYWNGIGEPHTQAPQVTDHEAEAEDEIIKAEAEVIAHKAWQQDLALDEPWEAKETEAKNEEQKDKPPTPKQQQRKHQVFTHNDKLLPEVKERDNLDHVVNMPIAHVKPQEKPPEEVALLNKIASDGEHCGRSYDRWKNGELTIDQYNEIFHNGHKLFREDAYQLAALASRRGDQQAANEYLNMGQPRGLKCPGKCHEQGLAPGTLGNCDPKEVEEKKEQQKEEPRTAEQQRKRKIFTHDGKPLPAVKERDNLDHIANMPIGSEETALRDQIAALRVECDRQTESWQNGSITQDRYNEIFHSSHQRFDAMREQLVQLALRRGDQAAANEYINISNPNGMKCPGGCCEQGLAPGTLGNCDPTKEAQQQQSNKPSAQEEALAAEAQDAWELYFMSPAEGPDGNGRRIEGRDARAKNPNFGEQQKARVDQLIEMAKQRGDTKAINTYETYWRCPEDCIAEGLALGSHGHCDPTKETQSQSQQPNGRWHAGYVGTDISRDGNTPTEAVNRLPSLKQQQSQSRQTQFAKRPQPMDLPIAPLTSDEESLIGEVYNDKTIYSHRYSTPGGMDGEAYWGRQYSRLSRAIAMAEQRNDKAAAESYRREIESAKAESECSGGPPKRCPGHCHGQDLSEGSLGHCDPITQQADASTAQTDEQRAEARKRSIFTHYGRQQETDAPARSNVPSMSPEESGLKVELDEAFADQCASQSKDRARFNAAQDRQRALIPQLASMASARGDEAAARAYQGHLLALETWCPHDCEKQGLAPGSHGHCNGTDQQQKQQATDQINTPAQSNDTLKQKQTQKDHKEHRESTPELKERERLDHIINMPLDPAGDHDKKSKQTNTPLEKSADEKALLHEHENDIGIHAQNYAQFQNKGVASERYTMLWMEHQKRIDNRRNRLIELATQRGDTKAVSDYKMIADAKGCPGNCHAQGLAPGTLGHCDPKETEAKNGIHTSQSQTNRSSQGGAAAFVTGISPDCPDDCHAQGLTPGSLGHCQPQAPQEEPVMRHSHSIPL